MKTYSYCSFDVFDTLITRKVADPAHVFLLTGIKAVSRFDLDIQPDVFSVERVNAEKDLFKTFKEPDIYKINTHLCERLGISDSYANKLAKLEFETEKEVCLPIPNNINRLKKLRDDGAKIIYISDMYLPANLIGELLTIYNINQANEPIMVSCEYGCNKSSGKLFDQTFEKLGIQHDDCIHYGNSQKSDIDGATKAGVDSEHLPIGNLNRYEEILSGASNFLNLNHEKVLHYSSIAASSRSARCASEKAEGNIDHTIYDVAASVAAPCLYAFVVDILKKAKGRPIFFMARDGYILHKIAKKIADARLLNQDLNYFFISRDILLLALLDDLSDKYFESEVHKIYSKYNVYEFIEMFGLSKTQAVERGCSIEWLNSEISSIESEKFRQQIKNSPVWEDLKKESNHRKSRFKRYIDEIGLLNSKEAILVDLGWNLTSQDLLYEIIKDDKVKMIGYYFGINRANARIDRGQKSGYLWDHRGTGKKMKINGIKQILEVFCTAPHGKTLDFRESGKTIEPILDNKEEMHLRNWGVEDLNMGILSTVDNILKYTNNETLDEDKYVIERLLNTFWNDPEKSEIQSWGKYPFYITDQGRDSISLHNEWPYFQLLQHVFSRGKMPYGHFDLWPNAHINKYSGVKKFLLLAAKSSKRSIKSVFRRIW